MWRLKHQFQFTFFSSHRLFFTLLPSLLLSHYLFADPSLSRSSSLCLCSNLAVSHLVIVVPKSHFLGRNTLAEGCSAITCRITRLSLTISWETGDNGLPRTRPSWQLAPSQTLTQRVWKKRAFSNNVHYVSLSPRIVMGSCLTLSWPVTSVNKCDCYIPPYFQKTKICYCSLYSTSGKLSALLAAGHADNNVSRSIVNQSARSSFFLLRRASHSLIRMQGNLVWIVTVLLRCFPMVGF